MSVFLVGDVAVIAMPRQLEPLPEVHHIGEVLNGVLRTDEAEIDQPFTTEKVEAGQRPAHGRILDLDAGVARAVADLFGQHARLDFSQKRRIAVVTHHVGKHHVGGNREELRLLHRTCHAEPVRLVGASLNEIVGLEQLRIGHAAETHGRSFLFARREARYLLRRQTLAVISTPVW